MNTQTIVKIAQGVQEDFGAGGLADGIYLDFAIEVAKRYAEEARKEERRCRTCGGAVGPYCCDECADNDCGDYESDDKV